MSFPYQLLELLRCKSIQSSQAYNLHMRKGSPRSILLETECLQRTSDMWYAEDRLVSLLNFWARTLHVCLWEFRAQNESRAHMLIAPCSSQFLFVVLLLFSSIEPHRVSPNHTLPLGSDFPIEGVNPLLGFYAAVSRLSVDGTSPHGDGGW